MRVLWLAAALASCSGQGDFGHTVRTTQRGDVCGDEVDPAVDEVRCADDLVCHPTFGICMTWADVHAACCACVFEACSTGDAYDHDADACGESMDQGEPLVVGGACEPEDVGSSVCVAECYLFQGG